MKNVIPFFAIAAIIATGCKKNTTNAANNSAESSKPAFTAVVNAKMWSIDYATSDTVGTSPNYSYSAHYQKEGDLFSISAYGAISPINISSADKMGIQIQGLTGPGTYSLNNGANTFAVYVSQSGQCAELDVYNATDDDTNTLAVTEFSGGKISGSFNFVAKSRTGVVRVANGVFTNIPIK